MRKEKYVSIGFIAGFILAIVMFIPSAFTLSRCYNAHIENNPSIVWTTYENGYCYTIQEVNGVEVQLSLSDYRKLQKVVGK